MAVLLQISGITKHYGAVTILEDATASFSSFQKIGVIGRNGAGKSTLCKIITGEEEMDSGSVVRNSELRLGYLEQHDSYKPEETVLQFLTRKTEQEEWKCGEVAARFQLKNEMLYVPIASLAGGFQTRVKLAAMLLKDPNFLILDEPSNYLDLNTLILLENFLQNFNGGYLIVSHDREFLKRTCEHTLEVENGGLTLYPGGIEEYFEFKEEELRQKLAYNKNVEKRKAELQTFIDRFRAKASTASRAKSKMKQLERLDTIEIEHPMNRVKIKIPQVENKTGTAVYASDLAIGYPGKIVADRITLEIGRGDKVAILGDNGQGKTTFLKTIAGALEPKAGSYRWGAGLKIAYYAQHVFSTLHPEDDVFTHLQREAADGVSMQNILDIAGCFLFSGDDVKKKIAVLSGGERARVCLAGLLLSRSHVLLLDEPTNHLDFETVEALGQALKNFAGTVFFISHDRTFVNLIANHILEVKSGSIRRYPGTYEDYVYHLECRARGENVSKQVPLAENSKADRMRHTPVSSGERGEEAPASGEKKKKSGRKGEKSALKAQIRKVEIKMGNIAADRDALLEDIKKNPFHYSRRRNDKLKELSEVLAKEEALWLELQSQLEKIEKE